MDYLIQQLASSDVTCTMTEQEIDRVIEMAWEDRTPFEAIQNQFKLTESDVISLMRKELKRTSFELWKKRVNGRATKHANRRNEEVVRFKCTLQRQISSNKISKR